MGPVLYSHDDDLVTGRFIERVNRFVLHVDVDGSTERAFLDETGRLTTVLVDDARVHLAPTDDPDRSTDYTAVAVEAADVTVSVRAALANDLFEAALSGDSLTEFSGAEILRREPPLPEHGRTDFLLEEGPNERYVEVKAVTHVEGGVGKFPDAPSERACRHLRALTALAKAGTSASIVFVCQRPDVEVVRPFTEIDPAFADALAAAVTAGVTTHALSVVVEPPVVKLFDEQLPVEGP